MTAAIAEAGNADSTKKYPGRAAVVSMFLDRPMLFHARQLRDEREQQARANLRAELATLAAP